jgi:acyl-CoA thioester hydrolase
VKYGHNTSIQLRFFDMDAFGHINNARYLTYFEEARIKYLDDIINWKYGWSETGIIMARAEVDFILPAHFKDEINIRTCCSRMGNKSFTLSYQMIKLSEQKQKETLLASAATVVVMYDYKSNSSIPVPDEWKKAIKNFETKSGNLL